MKTNKFFLLLVPFLIVIFGFWIAFSKPPSSKEPYRTVSLQEVSTKEPEDPWKKKMKAVRAFDEVPFKMGVFEKVEFGTEDRVDITLNLRDRTSYQLALAFAPEFKKAGFTTMRLKHRGSDRYEDHSL